MSSTLRQLETASTRSPLRRDCTKTMPGALATTSCSCWTSSSESRSIAPGRAVASRMRKTAISPPIRSAFLAMVDQPLNLAGRPGQGLGLYAHDLDAGADGVLDGLDPLGGSPVPPIGRAVRTCLDLHGEVIHPAASG